MARRHRPSSTPGPGGSKHDPSMPRSRQFSVRLNEREDLWLEEQVRDAVRRGEKPSEAHPNHLLRMLVRAHITWFNLTPDFADFIREELRSRSLSPEQLLQQALTDYVIKRKFVPRMDPSKGD